MNLKFAFHGPTEKKRLLNKIWLLVGNVKFGGRQIAFIIMTKKLTSVHEANHDECVCACVGRDESNYFIPMELD